MQIRRNEEERPQPDDLIALGVRTMKSAHSIGAVKIVRLQRGWGDI